MEKITTTENETTMNTNTENEEAEMETTNSETESTETEQEMSGEEVALTEEVEADKKKVKAKPAYEAFLQALETHAQVLGLASKDQKGFFQFANAITGHKLYIAKGDRIVKRVDTTLPESALSGISVPLEKPNGRIACHVEPTVEAVQLALDVLASYSEKIPAPKRQPKAKAESTETIVEQASADSANSK